MSMPGIFSAFTHLSLFNTSLPRNGIRRDKYFVLLRTGTQPAITESIRLYGGLLKIYPQGSLRSSCTYHIAIIGFKICVRNGRGHGIIEKFSLKSHSGTPFYPLCPYVHMSAIFSRSRPPPNNRYGKSLLNAVL
jgi:hypothetical protein